MQPEKSATRPVTIRQLAILAGVSRTTVSLALRNHPALPAATRERIKKLAQRHGYNPDSLISTLMTRIRTDRKKRTAEKLALLTFWDTRDDWRNSHNERRYFEGVCERAKELGYQIEHFWALEPNLSGNRLSKILYTRSIQGVLLFPFPFPKTAKLANLDWEKFASVAVGFTMDSPYLHGVTHEHFNGMRLTMRELRRRGYQRIGFANPARLNGGVGERWLAAYLLEQQISGDQPVQPYLAEQWDFDQFAAWLKKQSPDAIISNFDTPLEFLRRLSVKVPDEIAFASLDLADKRSANSGINQYPEQIGRSAVDFLASQLHHNKYGIPQHPEYLEIEGVWQDGNTTRNTAKSAARINR